MTKQAVRKTLSLIEGVRKTKRRPKAAEIVYSYEQIMVESLAEILWTPIRDTDLTSKKHCTRSRTVENAWEE
jgi:hypothetical protein